MSTLSSSAFLFLFLYHFLFSSDYFFVILIFFLFSCLFSPFSFCFFASFPASIFYFAFVKFSNLFLFFSFLYLLILISPSCPFSFSPPYSYLLFIVIFFPSLFPFSLSWSSPSSISFSLPYTPFYPFLLFSFPSSPFLSPPPQSPPLTSPRHTPSARDPTSSPPTPFPRLSSSPHAHTFSASRQNLIESKFFCHHLFHLTSTSILLTGSFSFYFHVHCLPFHHYNLFSYFSFFVFFPYFFPSLFLFISLFSYSILFLLFVYSIYLFFLFFFYVVQLTLCS